MVELMYAKWRAQQAEEMLKERREDKDVRKEFNAAWDILEDLEHRYSRFPHWELDEVRAPRRTWTTCE